MPSTMIHLAVASEINKKTRRNNDKFLIGSIAPDIAKFIGEPRDKTHFSSSNDLGIPNLDEFLEKYKKHLNNDFVLGYFIHLYTDYLWEKYFVSEIYDQNMIKKLDGSMFKCSVRTALIYIYNDYTNLNVRLLDEYNMDLHIFYNDLPEIENIIDEIPLNKMPILMDAMSLMIEKTKQNKDYVFNMEHVNKFISMATQLILADLEELNIT